MKGTGPVQVEGLGTVTAENVVAVTLSQAYARFPDRTLRQEVLGDVAEAVFKKLVTGDYPSLRPLATAIVDAAAERRIILHMARPTSQRAVVELGVDGRLPALGRDFAALAVQNFSANKLDYYVDTALRISGSRPPGELGHVRAEVTVTNAAPREARPVYVFGPNLPSQRTGLYNGNVSLYLPVGSALSGSTGTPRPPVADTEAGRTVLSFPVNLEAGQSQRVVFDLVLPPAPRLGYRFDLPVLSRVRPTQVSLDLDLGGTPLRFTGPLIRSLSLG
jgi:hypothetical protein